MSLYSGGLLQELLFHVQLARLGLTVEWVLADPYYFTGASLNPEREKVLSEFLSYSTRVSQDLKCNPPQVTLFSSWEQFQKNPEQFERGKNFPIWLAFDIDQSGEDRKIANFFEKLPTGHKGALLSINIQENYRR